ncbi:hypothetical protein AAFF_G00401130 [Aldrovandia affinis]|uniref:Uncharacterized protein n=1 Tax=Aldrovandia affinis TaxID=143900 RepID=A0AAD7SCK9_9TELE|nr:hypothetical protein AAFF_G00401130 [Aldrovandia affinis]
MAEQHTRGAGGRLNRRSPSGPSSLSCPMQRCAVQPSCGLCVDLPPWRLFIAPPHPTPPNPIPPHLDKAAPPPPMCRSQLFQSMKIAM